MATELGKAYVQIVPSAKGISGSIKKVLSPEATSAGVESGSSFASNLISKAKGIIATAGIGAAIAKTISEGGKLEQSIGGVETLFKKSADTVIANAKQAYKTVGVSANEYMQNVTSFSASLLQSVGGDTKKAAEAANTAMIDMADNANKMGSDLSSIQTAYQGFAKQNYTMLDNLKLGYGGTKAEMERLLEDATKLSGVEYNLDNLSDVYEAIHVIQGELGITGTTAKEASITIEGSMNAMKAAFTDLLGSLAMGEGVGESMQHLGETVSTFLMDNLIPMVVRIIGSLPEALAGFFTDFIPSFVEKGTELVQKLAEGVTNGYPKALESFTQLISKAIDYISENLPKFLEKGIELVTNMVKGIGDSLPKVIESVGNILNKIIEFFMQNWPKILKSGVDLVVNLTKGLVQAIPKVVEALLKIITKMISTIAENLPQYLKAGAGVILELIKGIVSIIPDVISTLKDLAGQGLDALGSAFEGVFNIGANLVKGLWEGIKSVTDWVLGKIKGFGSSIVKGIKGIFGVHSPSTVFADIGKNLNLGLAEGITGNLRPVDKAMSTMEDAVNGTFTRDIKFNTSSSLSGIDFSKGKKDEEKPLNLVLNIGGKTFKAFVESISTEQNKSVDLELAY